jgi:hypothetical protein
MKFEREITLQQAAMKYEMSIQAIRQYAIRHNVPTMRARRHNKHGHLVKMLVIEDTLLEKAIRS